MKKLNKTEIEAITSQIVKKIRDNRKKTTKPPKEVIQLESKYKIISNKIKELNGQRDKIGKEAAERGWNIVSYREVPIPITKDIDVLNIQNEIIIAQIGKELNIEELIEKMAKKFS